MRPPVEAKTPAWRASLLVPSNQPLSARFRKCRSQEIPSNGSRSKSGVGIEPFETEQDTPTIYNPACWFGRTEPPRIGFHLPVTNATLDVCPLRALRKTICFPGCS